MGQFYLRWSSPTHTHDSLDDLHDHFDDRFCIVEHRNNNVFWTIWYVYLASVFNSLFDCWLIISAWGVRVRDFERLRALCIHRGVRILFYFTRCQAFRFNRICSGFAELLSSNSKTANVTFECGWTAIFSTLELGEFLRHMNELHSC